MKARRLLPLLLAIVVVVFGRQWLDNPQPSPAPAPVPPQTQTQAPAPSNAPPADALPEASPLVVPDVTVRDMDGRVAWRGDVDLAPTLARIQAGERDPHRNDGGVFGNREGRLPRKPSGYYREYVVRTPGISHAGPQRLIIGKQGEVFYTSDHYANFRRIR
jgi:filamentous hemagglutinin